MAELWVMTRSYEEPCTCPRAFGRKDHRQFCIAPARRQSVISLVLVSGLRATWDDQTWTLWSGRG